MTVFKLPDLGEGLPDAEISKWLVKVGDHVKVNQIIAEVETAKAIVEVPSPVTGVIMQLHGQAGDVIKTGEALVTFTVDENNQKNNHAATTLSSDKPKSSSKRMFLLPDLGEGLPDAEITQWHIKIGDKIETNQIIVNVETAKAVVEIPAPFSGTVTQLFGQTGDIIETGKPLLEISIEQGSENNPNIVGESQTSSTYVDESNIFNDGINATPAVRALAQKLNVDLSQLSAANNNQKISLSDVEKAHQHTDHQNQCANSLKAGPAARARAKKLGIDIQQVQPSGPRNNITVQDIESMNINSANMFDIASGKGVKAAPKIRDYAKQHNINLKLITPSGHASNITLSDVRNQLGSQASSNTQSSNTAVPLRSTQRMMFMTMTQAREQVMNTTIFDDANVSTWLEDTDITMRFVRAVIAACKAEPSLNATFDEQTQAITLHNIVNLGIAVDSPHGLYVPVIKHADQKNPATIRNELNQLRENIKSRTSKPQDFQQGTITLSNFGMIAGRYATPVVTPPQVAILATGGFYKQLDMDENNQLKQITLVPLSLSFDHRLVSGGQAARFLAALITDLKLPS